MSEGRRGDVWMFDAGSPLQTTLDQIRPDMPFALTFSFLIGHIVKVTVIHLGHLSFRRRHIPFLSVGHQ